jgi:ribonuclease Z
MKKALIICACILFAAAAGLVALMKSPGPLVKRATDRIIDARDARFIDDGGLHLFLCGTGTPLSAGDRAGACTAVLAGGRFFIVDAGPGSWANMAAEGLPAARLSGILVTHFHSDHIGELGEAATKSWIMGRRGPLPVYGPAGVEQVARGFNDAYEADRRYRVAHHGAENLPIASGMLAPVRVACAGPGSDAVVLDEGGLKIIAFTVDHRPVVPAYGYRIEYRGKVAVISGDTRKCANLAKHAAGADVLVHEAISGKLSGMSAGRLKERGLLRLAKMAGDAIEYHTTADEAVGIARAAGAKKLVLTHLAPPVPPAVPDVAMRLLFFRQFVTGYDGPIIFGKDRMWVHVR